MDLALLGGRCRFRPDAQFQIELLELRLTYLAHARTRQHADPDDACSALIHGRVQHFGQLRDFFMGQEALARSLDPLLEACRRIVCAPSPCDGKTEHLAQHLSHAVGADWRGLLALQLARAVVGFLLRRTRPALGYDVE